MDNEVQSRAAGPVMSDTPASDLPEQELAHLVDLAKRLSEAAREARDKGAANDVVTLRFTGDDARQKEQSIRIVASHYGDLIQALEDQGFKVSVSNNGVHINTQTSSLASQHMHILGQMLEATLIENMGGLPDGAEPTGGWLAHDAKAQEAIARSREMAREYSIDRGQAPGLEQTIVSDIIESIQSEFGSEAEVSRQVRDAMRDTIDHLPLQGADVSGVRLDDLMLSVKDHLTERLQRRIEQVCSRHKGLFDERMQYVSDHLQGRLQDDGDPKDTGLTP